MLHVSGCDWDFPLYMNTPLLESALFGSPYSVVSKHQYCMFGLLGAMPFLRRLELKHLALQHLAVGDTPANLPIVCPVKHLILWINFKDLKEMQAAFCIFRCSPYIRILDLTSFWKEGFKIWEEAKIVETRISADAFWKGEEDLDLSKGKIVTKVTGMKDDGLNRASPSVDVWTVVKKKKRKNRSLSRFAEASDLSLKRPPAFASIHNDNYASTCLHVNKDLTNKVALGFVQSGQSASLANSDVVQVAQCTTDAFDVSSAILVGSIHAKCASLHESPLAAVHVSVESKNCSNPKMHPLVDESTSESAVAAVSLRAVDRKLKKKSNNPSKCDTASNFLPQYKNVNIVSKNGKLFEVNHADLNNYDPRSGWSAKRIKRKKAQSILDPNGKCNSCMLFQEEAQAATPRFKRDTEDKIWTRLLETCKS